MFTHNPAQRGQKTARAVGGGSRDDPVPQMVEQLPDVMRFFDFLLPVPEQVIEVPKILLDDVPMRTAVRDTQLAEHLVEVPTIVSNSWL